MEFQYARALLGSCEISTREVLAAAEQASLYYSISSNIPPVEEREHEYMKQFLE